MTWLPWLFIIVFLAVYGGGWYAGRALARRRTERGGA